MTCCITTITPFVNVSSSVVPYSGNKPTVTVAYLIGGVWQAMGVASQIKYGASDITVDHGGPGQTGVIKFVQ